MDLAGTERCKAAAAQPLRQAAEAGGPVQQWAPMPKVPAQHDTFRQRLLPSPAQLASGPSPDGASPAVAAAAAVTTCTTAEVAVAGSTVVASAAAAVSMAPASAAPAQRGGRRGDRLAAQC